MQLQNLQIMKKLLQTFSFATVKKASK